MLLTDPVRAALAAGLLVAAACHSDSTTPSAPVQSVLLSPLDLSVTVGDSVLVTADPIDATGRVLTNQVIVWSSSNTGVAEVDAAGEVLGVAPGSAWIRAADQGVSDSTAVTVTALSTLDGR
jgi:uncharacterized protein YjdB